MGNLGIFTIFISHTGGSSSQCWVREDKGKLNVLKNEIPKLLKAAYAPSTWDKYTNGWGAWEKWCNSNGLLDICPASPLDVALYLTHVFNLKGKRGSLDDDMP